MQNLCRDDRRSSWDSLVKSISLLQKKIHYDLCQQPLHANHLGHQFLPGRAAHLCGVAVPGSQRHRLVDNFFDHHWDHKLRLRYVYRFHDASGGSIHADRSDPNQNNKANPCFLPEYNSDPILTANNRIRPIQIQLRRDQKHSNSDFSVQHHLAGYFGVPAGGLSRQGV